MSQHNSIELALGVAEDKRQQAQQQWAQALQADHQARAQMEQLAAYRQEMEHRWTMRAQSGANPSHLQCHYGLMAKLEHAEAYQRHVLASCVTQVQQAEQHMQQAERRLMVLQRLRARIQERQHRLVQRREQKRNDEMAANVSRRRTMGMESGAMA